MSEEVKPSAAEQLANINNWEFPEEDDAVKTVKIKIGKIVSDNFQASLKKLTCAPALSGAMTYKAKKLGKKVEKIIELFNETQIEVLKQYAKKDKDGELISTPLPNGKLNYNLIEEHIKDYDKKMKEVNDLEIEFDKVQKAELGNSHGLLPFDFMQLDFIIIKKEEE